MLRHQYERTGSTDCFTLNKPLSQNSYEIQQMKHFIHGQTFCFYDVSITKKSVFMKMSHFLKVLFLCQHHIYQVMSEPPLKTAVLETLNIKMIELLKH